MDPPPKKNSSIGNYYIYIYIYIGHLNLNTADKNTAISATCSLCFRLTHRWHTYGNEGAIPSDSDSSSCMQRPLARKPLRLAAGAFPKDLRTWAGSFWVLDLGLRFTVCGLEPPLIVECNFSNLTLSSTRRLFQIARLHKHHLREMLGVKHRYLINCRTANSIAMRVVV